MTPPGDYSEYTDTSGANVQLMFGDVGFKPTFYDKEFNTTLVFDWNQTANFTHTKNLFVQTMENFKMGTFGKIKAYS